MILLKLDEIQEQIDESLITYTISRMARSKFDTFCSLTNDGVVDKAAELNDVVVNQAPADEPYPARAIQLQCQSEKEKTVVKSRWLKVGYFTNKLQVLPAVWVFPKMTCYQLVMNGLTSDFENNVSAF